MLPPPERAGKYGSYGCDAPRSLVKSAIRYMKQVLPDPDFILWTGDSSPHYKTGPGWDTVYGNLRQIIKYLYQEFGSETKVVPALGNHDTPMGVPHAVPHGAVMVRL